MNCPKCGKSLWFVKSFCPFCKTKIVRPPRLPETPLPLFHWVMLGAWSVWFAYLVFALFTDRSWMERQGRELNLHAAVLGATLGMPIHVGIVGWLGWRLYRRPSRRVTIWFIVLSVLLAWKTWIGPAVLFRGSENFSVFGPIAWWSSIGRISMKTFLLWMLPSQIVLFSLLVWPAYCWRTRCLDACPA